ncbi:hypothetical protein W02_25600 [Nitrospira sp. KM1]|uniref:AsmA family protein n=1 Tax=Nitrospira sp. KM1 TaxID=1936990 RepID=UPI0013A7AE28|nr:AsmA family protein [Nitrospira sp. KM1]BCA55420.1 hypothetical protein W02_25600 [Nitrospira sp. KM1]
MKLFIGLLLFLGLIVVAILTLPFLVDLADYQDHYKPLVEEALNRKIQLQKARLTLWPQVGARIAGFTVLEDPAFGNGSFASLSSLDIGVKLLPLFSGTVEIEAITLRDPVITVIKSSSGILNVSTIGGSGHPQPSSPTVPPEPSGNPLQALALLAVDRVTIEHGMLIYRDLSSQTVSEHQLQDLNVSLTSVHLGSMPAVHAEATILPSNLAVRIDGTLGPLAERPEIERYAFDLRAGNMSATLTGKLVNQQLNARLSSPSIKSADLPIQLPVTKPVEIKDFLVEVTAPYPVRQGVSAMESVHIQNLSLAVAVGQSLVTIKGTMLGGTAQITASAASIDTADIPVELPLTKPAAIKDFHLAAAAKLPIKNAAAPLEIADVSDLRFGVLTGASAISVKGTVREGQAKVLISSPTVKTSDLPVKTPFVQPVDLQDLRATLEMKGREIKLSGLTVRFLEGQTSAQGSVTTGLAAPPFTGNMTMKGMQLSPALKSLHPDSPVSLSGTAAMNLAVAGQGFSIPESTKALTGTGHVDVKNGRIEGVNLVDELAELFKAAGVSPASARATVFSTLESDLALKGGVVRVQKLFMDSHDFQAVGRGTVGLDQTLNLVLNLNLSQTVSRKLTQSSPLVKIALKDGRLRLPLFVTGTVQNPSYGIDLKDLTGKIQEQVQDKAKEAVKGLLDGTKTPRDLEREGRDLLNDLLGR